MRELEQKMHDTQRTGDRTSVQLLTAAINRSNAAFSRSIASIA